ALLHRSQAEHLKTALKRDYAATPRKPAIIRDGWSFRSSPAELAGQVAVAEAVTKHGAQSFEEIAGMLEVVAEYRIADAFGTMSFGRVAAEQSFELPPLDLLEALLRQQAMGLEQGEEAALAEVV